MSEFSKQLLTSVRRTLRETSNEFDEEIESYIDTCAADMAEAGILSFYFDPSRDGWYIDGQILQAVRWYCLSVYGLYNPDMEKYARAYASLKSTLATQTKYSKDYTHQVSDSEKAEIEKIRKELETLSGQFADLDLVVSSLSKDYAAHKKTSEQNMKELGTSVQQAISSSVNAQASAINAQNSANRAQESANNAQESANAAQDTANNAVEIANASQDTSNHALEIVNVAHREVLNTQKSLEEEIARAKAAEQANSDAIRLLTEGVSEEEIDGVKDLIKYTKEHGTEVTQMQKNISGNASAIGKEKTVNDKQQNFLDYINNVESEGLNIQIDWENSSATVVDVGEFRGENLVIPSYYQGFPVTTIGDQAFNYSSVHTPKRIKLSDTITHISGGAFQENAEIEEVILSKGLQYIDGAAFEYFYGKSLVIPKSVETVGGYAFMSSDVTLYIEAESKPDGWSDEWDEMHAGKIVWGYAPDFESVNKKLTALEEANEANAAALEDYKLGFNLENGSGENSVQIKTGNAQGKNSVDLSESVEATFIGYAYTTEYLETNFSNSLSDEEKQRLFPVKRVAYKGWVYDSLSDTAVITFGDGSYVRPKDYGYEWVYYSASGERLIAYGDDPSDDTSENVDELYVDVDTYIKHIEVYRYSDWSSDYSEFLEDLGVFDTLVSVYGAETEKTGAKGNNTLTAGKGTRATKEGQSSFGTFNEVDDDALLMVGNGTKGKPSNALVVKKNGDVYAGKDGKKRLMFADDKIGWTTLYRYDVTFDEIILTLPEEIMLKVNETWTTHNKASWVCQIERAHLVYLADDEDYGVPIYQGACTAVLLDDDNSEYYLSTGNLTLTIMDDNIPDMLIFRGYYLDFDNRLHDISLYLDYNHGAQIMAYKGKPVEPPY